MAKRGLKLLGLEHSVVSESKKRWNYDEDVEDSHHVNRISNLPLFYFLLFAVSLIFFSRLFILTVIDGEKNRVLADSNRIKLLEIEAERGEIFDEHGTALVNSRRAYFLESGQVKTEITKEQSQKMERQGEASENFEGPLGKITQSVVREYSLGEAGSHVFGYTSIVQEADLEKNNTLSTIDFVGRLGIEETYNEFLRGENGKRLIEVDATGSNVSILGEEDARKGKDLKLTLNANLQKKAFEVLRDHAEKSSKKGAVVIQNPETGGVLALVSYPSFDPTNVGKAVGNIEKPFFNRATQGDYPPGSVFKIVSALAGLESGKITQDTEIEDVGEFSIGEFKFPNWYWISYGRRDGILKIDRAIARSNDIFFYRLAERVGLDFLHEMAVRFGYGSKTGVDLPGESFGLVPSAEWKESAFDSQWFLGDTMHLGIGQSFMLSTPIQVNNATAAVATGKLMKPYLVSAIEDADGEFKNISSKVNRENLASRENLAIVRDGMRQTCEDGGTGWPFFEAGYKVGCKTGTAEKSLGNPHAWFTAYAPFDAPEIVITVLVEDGGEGSSVAGPVAKEILDWYFSQG